MALEHTVLGSPGVGPVMGTLEVGSPAEVGLAVGTLEVGTLEVGSPVVGPVCHNKGRPHPGSTV